MVNKKDALLEEIKDVKEQIELYIKSNPNYKRKDVEEKKEDNVVITKMPVDYENAFNLVANVILLNQFTAKHN